LVKLPSRVSTWRSGFSQPHPARRPNRTNCGLLRADEVIE
jgi:hypothetical protein